MLDSRNTASGAPGSRSPARAVLARLWQYGRLMRIDRPIGVLLLLWPTLWALWIAGDGRPNSTVFLVFVAGVFVMRSAGCVINDYADRHVDPGVSRTRDRPLAAGLVTNTEALVLFAGLLMVAFALVLTMNRLTILLSFVGAALAATYPFTKRFTSLPQFYLGLSFGWAVPMAFAAQTGSVPAVAWVLVLAVAVWAAFYDTIYAMVDREDDLRVGVRSTAILFGRADRYAIAIMQMVFLALLLRVGRMADLSTWYDAGVMGAAGFALYQQALIAERKPADCFRAFLNNNALGAAVFSGIVLHYTFT